MRQGSLLLIALFIGSLPQAGAAQSSSPAQATRDEIKGMFGFVPTFLNTCPDSALPGAWEEMKTLQMNPNTAIPGKYKELIGLAVSAQVPCHYCIYAHAEFAKLNGATDAEIGEAVMMAALTRHWSTVLQGYQTDLGAFRGEVAKMIEQIKKSQAGKAPAPVNVVDQKTALQEIQNSFGSVPDFLRRFPAEAISGAWKEMRDVEMNPNSAIPGKYKSLIGVAVAAQIPCRFCLVADTEFAKIEGATERELSEAIAMSALTRHWSTYLNGTQQSEATFKRDVDRMVRTVKLQQAKALREAARVTKAGAGAESAPVAKAAPTARTTP